MSDNYFVALDKKSVLWTFLPEESPFAIDLEAFKSVYPDSNSTPVQIVCSNIHAATLTKSGNVYVWWPKALRERLKITGGVNPEFPIIPREYYSEESKDCYILQRLPALPVLPIIKQKGCITENEVSPKLIKIAAVRGGLLGLNAKGHVLMINPGPTNDRPEIGNWLYVSLFLVHFNLNSLNSNLLFILDSYRT